jgi:hypothetical protein
VASLNGGSVSVASSNDDDTQSSQSTPVVAGLPADDREWIAAYGSHTSLLTFHDASGSNIDVLRSDNGGQSYQEIAVAIPPTQDNAPQIASNQHGNLVIDRHTTAGVAQPPPSPVTGQIPGPGFWAYQAFVAPADTSDPALPHDEVFVSASNDGGYTWGKTPNRIGCSEQGPSVTLDHAFPILSVDPAGNLWATWSDDKNVYTAVSPDHGSTWTCSPPVSTITSQGQAIYPWIVATSAGVDLVYYASPTPVSNGASQTFYVYFAQNLSGTVGGWGTPQQLFPVHQGAVCEQGATCTSDRQLYDDFGVDTDPSGWAHIAYTSDAEDNIGTKPGKFDLGQPGSATGYAVQTGGPRIGSPN